jgi:hypothetical protein
MNNTRLSEHWTQYPFLFNIVRIESYQISDYAALIKVDLGNQTGHDDTRGYKHHNLGWCFAKRQTLNEVA